MAASALCIVGAAFAVSLLANGDAGQEASSRPGVLARLPAHRVINLRCMGSGRPTVLFEGGWAASSLSWTKVQSLLAPRLRACAYDRAGYGFSDPGPMPRDGAAIARDLDQALQAARLKGPFIVVGHSAGGLYMRLFTDRRPDEVVGMVLVDPSVEYQDRRFASAFGPGAGSVSNLHDRTERCLAAAEAGALPSGDATLVSCAPPPGVGESLAAAAERLAEAKRPYLWKTELSELDTLWTSTSDEVSAGRRDYGDLPMIILTAEGTYAAASPAVRAAATQFWIGLHAEIAARSRKGVQRIVERSSHLMPADRPDAIATAIEELAFKAKP